MGQEIADSHFTPADFEGFAERLRQETALLDRWFRDGGFHETANAGGFELESCLVDGALRPAPMIDAFLARLNSTRAVPELATFNLELNGRPCVLNGKALRALRNELQESWDHCSQVAGEMGAGVAMVGILPTIRPDDLTLANMSPLHRYHALNEQVLRQRGGRPLELSVAGRDNLRLTHGDVMLESAATSFQIHLKINAAEGARFYNASKIVSAPMVAVCANSPYLFGHDLWDETRIPLFEQAVSVGGSRRTKRVSFGIRYARETIMECFEANLARYPVLLPRIMDEPAEGFAHLRLHNGTIWRWNRPLIGFETSGSPHLRIEHRVVPAGPSIDDAIANAAFYFGMVSHLARQPQPPESRLPFKAAKENFYRAAKYGLRSELQWLDGRRHPLPMLCRERLLPLAREGLHRMEIDKSEVDDWLGIIEARVATGRNGAAWQRRWVAENGLDMPSLTRAYLECQNSGAPVHEWPLPS